MKEEIDIIRREIKNKSNLLDFYVLVLPDSKPESKIKSSYKRKKII